MPTNTPTPTNTPAPVSTPGVNPLNGFGIVNAMMNPTNYFNPNANYFSQSTPQQVAGPTPTTPADRQAALAGVRQTVNKIDPSGAVGAVKSVATKFAPAVVQIVRDTTNPNSAKAFMRIAEDQLETFKGLIDNTGFLRMPGATKNEVYHLTYKTPQQMIERGFQDLGTAKADMIPKTPKIQPRTSKGLYDFK